MRYYFDFIFYTSFRGIISTKEGLPLRKDFKFDRLNFVTAGMPLRTGKGSYPEAFDIIRDMNLDGMELEFVHGVRMSPENKEKVSALVKERKLIII